MFLWPSEVLRCSESFQWPVCVHGLGGSAVWVERDQFLALVSQKLVGGLGTRTKVKRLIYLPPKDNKLLRMAVAAQSQVRRRRFVGQWPGGRLGGFSYYEFKKERYGHAK